MGPTAPGTDCSIEEVLMLDQAYYPESQLQIMNWFKEKDTFVVACVRCGNGVEISSQLLLEPLECPQCDGIPENHYHHTMSSQPKKTNNKISALVPAHINLPNGVQIFVYLPILLEGPYGDAN
jgi:hypothetical protein